MHALMHTGTHTHTNTHSRTHTGCNCDCKKRIVSYNSFCLSICFSNCNFEYVCVCMCDCSQSLPMFVCAKPSHNMSEKCKTRRGRQELHKQLGGAQCLALPLCREKTDHDRSEKGRASLDE
ncbi:unnamed protein product [Boreogadus saida]